MSTFAVFGMTRDVALAEAKKQSGLGFVSSGYSSSTTCSAAHILFATMSPDGCEVKGLS